MKHARITAAIAIALVAVAPPARAQRDSLSRVGTKVEAAKQAKSGTEQALEQVVFPPELVMQHQQKIDLKPEQKKLVRQAIVDMQTKVIDVQFTLQDEAERLQQLLERPQVNEGDALSQVDRVLNAERELKRAHMAMLVRVKNALTQEQQTMLRELRKASRWEDGPMFEERRKVPWD